VLNAAFSCKIPNVNRFGTVKQAKDYLAGRIADEAGREGIPLSEIERKMLYFSETDWTLPDMMQVSGEFDRDYEQDDYEKKIGTLVRKIGAHRHSHNPEEEQCWDQAVEKLSEGDNYLSVLVGTGLLPSIGQSQARPPHDVLKLWLTGFAIVFGLITVGALGNWLFGPRFWTIAGSFSDRGNFGFLVLVAIVAWFAWKIRNELKSALKGLLSRK